MDLWLIFSLSTSDKATIKFEIVHFFVNSAEAQIIISLTIQINLAQKVRKSSFGQLFIFLTMLLPNKTCPAGEHFDFPFHV